jgi:hypothetical protein
MDMSRGPVRRILVERGCPAKAGFVIHWRLPLVLLFSIVASVGVAEEVGAVLRLILGAEASVRKTERRLTLPPSARRLNLPASSFLATVNR